MKKDKNITILLVEDEAISVIAGRNILEKNGYSVITASTGEEAVEIVSGNDVIDIVLMDIDLGDGIDGIKAAELILAKRDLPILFLSSHTEPDILNETGVVISYGYVVKKTGEAVLLASIETAIRLFEANRYIETQKIELASRNKKLMALVEELEAMNDEFEAMNEELIGSNRLLAEKEEEYRLLFENASSGIVIAQDGIVRMVNPALGNILGYPVEEIVSRPFTDFIHPEDSEMVKQRHMARLKGEDVETEYSFRIISSDGMVKWVNLRSALINWNGKPASLNYVIDITESKIAEKQQRKLQEQLAQSQKMESVGRLAGGVAHDFNNMLGVILGNAELALQSIESDNPAYADLMEIKKAAERSAELTRQLLAFARRQVVTPRVLDLNEIVSGMLNMLGRLIGENIELQWEPGENLAPVKLDPAQIDQVLANLSVNARDAISGIGKIIIRTKGIVFSGITDGGDSDSPEGEYILLEVEDNGSGMDKNTLDNLFEPFFTTKGAGQGTGLGLATVYGIVKQNDGFINVDSEPGEGTVIKLFLPACSGESARPASAVLEDLQDGADETILLVEDELSILNVAVKMLQSLGYKVIAASTPGEALRLADEHSGEISLLMTDVIMPEMNGRELSRSILSKYPEMKILYMSGYTADVMAKQGVLGEGVHFIQKPFSMQELALKVREVLS